MGDGTEGSTDHDHDDDDDMELDDRDEQDLEDLKDAARKGQEDGKSESGADAKGEVEVTVSDPAPSKSTATTSGTPAEPKMHVPVDNADTATLLSANQSSTSAKEEAAEQK